MRLLTTSAWQRTRRLIAVVVAMVVTLPMAVLWSAGMASAHDGHGTTSPFSALVFSKTAAFRHGSIPAGVAAIEKLGAEHGFTVDATEDAGAFTDANLAKYDVVIWLSTTGDVLDTTQQAAFERYIKAGGGYAGVHAASDTEYDWPWYGELVGAYFSGHPAGTPAATVKVADHAHPSTAELPSLWNRDRRVVQLPHQPDGQGARPGLARRDVLHRRHDGRRAPDLVVPRLRRWPRLVHRPRPHRRELHRPALPLPPARRHPHRRGRPVRRLRGDAAGQLREGHARRQHRQPDGARHRRGRSRVLRRPQR